MLVSLGAPGTRGGRQVGIRLVLAILVATALSPLREKVLLVVCEWLSRPPALLPAARPISPRAAGPQPARAPLLKEHCPTCLSPLPRACQEMTFRAVG